MKLDPTAIASLAVQIPLVLAFMAFTLVLQDRFTKSLEEQMSVLRGLSRRFEILAMAVAIHDAKENGSEELQNRVRQMVDEEKTLEEVERLRRKEK